MSIDSDNMTSTIARLQNSTNILTSNNMASNINVLQTSGNIFQSQNTDAIIHETYPRCNKYIGLEGYNTDKNDLIMSINYKGEEVNNYKIVSIFWGVILGVLSIYIFLKKENTFMFQILRIISLALFIFFIYMYVTENSHLANKKEKLKSTPESRPCIGPADINGNLTLFR